MIIADQYELSSFISIKPICYELVVLDYSMVAGLGICGLALELAGQQGTTNCGLSLDHEWETLIPAGQPPTIFIGQLFLSVFVQIGLEHYTGEKSSAYT
jgi:hypothetical protein